MNKKLYLLGFLYFLTMIVLVALLLLIGLTILYGFGLAFHYQLAIKVDMLWVGLGMFVCIVLTMFLSFIGTKLENSLDQHP